MSQTTQLQPEVLTVSEAAAYLRVDPQVVVGFLESGHLPGLRLADGDWRLGFPQLLALVNGSAPTTTAPREAFQGNEEPAKVGVLVRRTMERLLASGALPAEELRRLQGTVYCHDTFGLGFPLLRKVAQGHDLDSQRLVGSYSRYWKHLFSGGYLVTSEWYERHRPAFLAWAARFEGEAHV